MDKKLSGNKLMIKQALVFCALMNILNLSNASPFVAESQLKGIRENMSHLSDIMKTSKGVSEERLPTPYNYLLTQALMTKGIEKYYQRTPMIQTIYAIKNARNNTYFRSIRMFVDRSKARDNVILARRKKETMVVEVAFITMNFNELPKKVIADVLHTHIPFGALLYNNHVSISTTDRTYFSVQCNKDLVSLIHCKLNSTLYGRTNTIIRADDHQWLARVVEILPGFLNPDVSKKGCCER